MLLDGYRARPVPRPGYRALVAAVLAAILLGLLAGVLTGSWVVDVDEAVYRWGPGGRWPALRPVADWWVLLGQRAVCLGLVVPWLALRAWRERDTGPLVALAVATLLTNLGVGGMKYLVGRLGPLQLGGAAGQDGAGHAFALGGSIFPSGHAANAVVTAGVLVMTARRHRRLGAALAAPLAAGVGLTTIHLGTHWSSDVLAGWCAGGLVLLAVAPAVRASTQVAGRLTARHGPRRRPTAGAGPSPRAGQEAGEAALSRAVPGPAQVRYTLVRPGPPLGSGRPTSGGRRRKGPTHHERGVAGPAPGPGRDRARRP